MPARLGEYELFDHIGRGGMADIYRARREGDFGVVREVVVKEILPELARVDRLAELLAAEAKTASRLEHTNVVRIEDLQRDESTLFIAMEYVDGLDLRELFRVCSRKGVWVPPELGLWMVIELLRALDYAHGFEVVDEAGCARRGIIHRDVSPSNVLISFEGEVKLCDFGIARSYDGDGTAHLESMVEGKAGYMSPEQARGAPLDGRADVFAAGIILFELLSGRKLYKAAPGQSLFEVARAAAVRPLPASDLPLHDRLASVVARALAPDPADRFATAGELARELERYAADASLHGSSIKLRRFLEEHVAPSVREQRRRRELATLALGLGPAVELEPIPVKEPRPAPAAPLAPTRGSSWWAVIVVALALLAAVAYMFAR